MQDKAALKELGITHIVNCSQGNGARETNTDARFYRGAGIKFHGIKAVDNPTFNMMPFFRDAVDFIDKALKSGGRYMILEIDFIDKALKSGGRYMIFEVSGLLLILQKKR